MKMFEHVVDERIRDIVKLFDNQRGFVEESRTISVIHVARLLWRSPARKCIDQRHSQQNAIISKIVPESVPAVFWFKNRFSVIY